MSKKDRKRRSMIAVILLITFLITGCEDKSVKTDHIIRIGVVTYTQDDPFINAMTDQLKENLKKMETDHMKIITTVKNGDDNQQDQNEIVEEMIDAGCDVLCVNLVDRTAPSRIIRMAKQEDIPVLFFNREPVREDLMQWEKLYYIGCDAEQSGIMQGEIVADYIKNHPEADKNQDGKIQYILLEGEAGHQDAISRTDYSVKTLLEQGINLEKLSYQFADWNRGQAENRMSRLIEQYGEKIELVISNNDEMALGAVAAWQKAGYDCQDWPVIFGIDGLDDALEAIETGKMQGTVYNDKEDQAMELAKLSVEIVCGKDTNRKRLKEGRYYVSEYCRVDSSNVDRFYKETDPVKRLELLKENTGAGESEEDKYRKQLWIARYGKRTPVKDEFIRCLMEMKYLAEGTTVDLGGKRRKQGAKIAATLGLSESLLQEKVYKEILLQELQNVFLKFIEVSRGGRAFTSLVFGMGQMSEEGVTKKIAQQISMIAFHAPHLLHMEKEFALLQEAALGAFRQVYPNREHFLKK